LPDVNGPSERARRPGRWIVVGTSVAAVGVLLLILAFGRRGGVPVETAPAVRRDLVVPILCDGTLEPPPGGEVRASESAIVAQVSVHEGQRVRKGAALLRLSNLALSQKAIDARAAVLSLAAQKARLASEVADDRKEVERTRRLFDAEAKLLREGAITREGYESDESSYRKARARLVGDDAELQSIAGPAPGVSRLALAEESARDLERRVAALTVRAPVDGVVYGLPRKVGETVEPGQLVAALADPADLRVRARVDQPDLPRVKVGQRLVVTFDGLPARRWDGKVELVSPGVRDVGGREVGEVVGRISDPDAALPPNASVNVQIVTGESKSALVVPRAALFRDGDQRYVYLLRGRRAHRQNISIGLLGTNDVEILSGVGPGDRVILPGAVPLTDGLRVAPQKG
jgi:multidrug efflux pump subunit AcrA (membrane-fusion protein)